MQPLLNTLTKNMERAKMTIVKQLVGKDELLEKKQHVCSFAKFLGKETLQYSFSCSSCREKDICAVCIATCHTKCNIRYSPLEGQMKFSCSCGSTITDCIHKKQIKNSMMADVDTKEIQFSRSKCSFSKFAGEEKLQHVFECITCRLENICAVCVAD